MTDRFPVNATFSIRYFAPWSTTMVTTSASGVVSFME